MFPVNMWLSILVSPNVEPKSGSLKAVRIMLESRSSEEDLRCRRDEENRDEEKYKLDSIVRMQTMSTTNNKQ
jgi:hypothetical protein